MDFIIWTLDTLSMKAISGMSRTSFRPYLNSEQFIKEEIKGQAKERVQLNLILAEIVKAENIEVSEEELNEELKTIASYYGKDVEEIKTIFAGQMGAITSDILNRKAINIIKGE